MLEVQQSFLSGLLFIQPKVFPDARGFFYESFQAKKYKEVGIDKNFVQDNLSRSFQHVIRGLHYQVISPQAKLVSVVRGEVFDVAVDMRPESQTFGQWDGRILNDENHCQIYIPEGFAHGFCVLSDIADFFYKCTDYYNTEGEKGVRFDDPDLNIDWGIENALAIVSEKDRAYPFLKDI